MVFHTRKNRRGARPKQPSAKATLNDLPDELLLHVLHSVDITAVLRLRETSRSFVPVCTEIIRDKLKVLYVHPSPSSVQRAIGICQSDLSPKVEEICFVSQTIFSRKYYPTGDRERRPWPLRGPKDEKVTTHSILSGHSDCTFEHIYRELLKSLAALEGLQTFSFQESCDKLGFNMVSAQRIANWLDTVSYRIGPHLTGFSRECRAENRLYAAKFKLVPPRDAFKFADIDALTAVLNHPGINFTNLNLSCELFGDPYALFGNPIPAPHAITCPQTLTRLDLVVNTFWKYCEWHQLSGELLRSTASTLLELRLGIRSQHTARRGDHQNSAWSLGQLLLDIESPSEKNIDLPKLQRLDLHAPPDRRLYTVQRDDVMVQLFDLAAFLPQHCKELRVFSLTDICPTIDHVTLANGYDSMGDIPFSLGVPASEIANLDREHTRAWNIDARESGATG